ncbi:MAG: BatD family protein [Phycisphaerae bacterium]|nr:BatD family protein [Phycisphaerae bacterium]
MQRKSFLIILAMLALAVSAFAPRALAQRSRQLAPTKSETVTADWSSRETVVDGVIPFEIKVHSKGDIEDPVLPTVDGGTLRLLPGRNQMTQTSIFNGRTEESFHVTFRGEFRAMRVGRVTIPPITVRVDGKEVATDPTTLVVLADDATDAKPIIVEIVSDPPSPLVGQPTTMTLRVSILPYRNPAQNISLDEQWMWRLVDLDQSNLGRFKQAFDALARSNRRPLGSAELRGDRQYFVYEIPMDYRASRPGRPELGDIEIELNVPIKARIARDFFGRDTLDIESVKKVRARAEMANIDVRPLPSEGQPAFFNGAVGSFTVSASAKPTDVAVGDPITVTYTITSTSSDDDEAALQELQAPPFATMPELASAFRIPSDPPAGTVNKRRKTFTQTFRPLSDSVREIPAIPFAFFDPKDGTYHVVESGPIAISVSPAERLAMSQIVGATPAAGDAAQKALTAVTGGLFANVPPSEALLADRRASLGLGVATAVALPPTLCVAAAVIVAVRRRRAADPLGRRAARAERAALEALGSSPTPETILTALTTYVADRCGLKDGERTRADATRALRERGAPTQLVDDLDVLLSRCERERYAPGSAAGVKGDEARALLRELERLPLARTRASRTEETR